MNKIGIAGVGGIGSNVAWHLVRSGITELKIVDLDKVEESNLNRQFYFKSQIGLYKVDALEENLKRINPDIYIEKEILFLTQKNIVECFKDCDIIVEGFDKAEAKTMLLEELLSSGKKIYSANGVAGLDLSSIESRFFAKNAFVAGDFKTDFHGKRLFSPKVTIVASVIANQILIDIGFKDSLD